MGYPAGARLEPHAHAWGQLVYASEGVMRVDAADGVWIVPSQRAVWIPAGVEHAIAMLGSVSLRTLYLAPALARRLPERCAVVAVSPLLRELILHAVATGPLSRERPEHRRLADFLLDLVRMLPAEPLELPMPRDPRALRAAQALLEASDAQPPVSALARQCGASRRTLERLFRAETGLPLGRWRQQARLLRALRLLAEAQPVGAVALEVGYQGASAFVAAFARALGTTPGRYFAPPERARLG